MKITSFLPLCFVLSFVFSSVCSAIISVDFTNETLEDRFNGYLGGWYGNQLVFDQWYGDAADASISGSELVVSSTAPENKRSAVVLLDPSDFAATGAGLYQLSFDLTSFSMSDSNPNTGDDYAFASIWGGSGYDLSEATADGLFVSPGGGTITALGSAVVAEIAREEFSSAGNERIVNFTYDGFSTIAIFLGAGEVGGWPFPTATFSNLEVTAVPEPKTIGFMFAVLVALGMRRFSRPGFHRYDS